MVRFYSSIYSDDKVLIRQMSRESAFHATPLDAASNVGAEVPMLGSVPDQVQRSLTRVGNSIFLAQRHDI
jgi:hypothetical protein